MIRSVNPFNNAELAAFEEEGFDILDKKLDDAERSFHIWKKSSVSERSELIQECADVLKNNREEYARLITAETGKVIKESLDEIDNCIRLCEYFALNAVNYPNEEIINLNDGKGEGIILYEPLGNILGIMPWSYPFWEVFRFTIPTLMTGNTITLKHSSRVPQCSLKMEEVFKKACFPDAVFQSILVSSSKIENLIKDDRIQGVCFTGGIAAGIETGKYAGKNIKKTVLELGGTDPFIVLEDADVNKAASAGGKSAMNNLGQSSYAAKRFIIHEKIADEFIQKLISNIHSLRFGDPLKKESDYASLAGLDQKKKLSLQVEKTINMGANVLWQENKADSGSAFFNPLLLTSVEPGMPAYEEVLFGPVMSIFKVKDTQEAVHIANDCEYGLGASIWTVDPDKAKMLAREIDAGVIYINEKVSSRPDLPYGGIKKSGIGKKLSLESIREFTNKKTVWYPL